MTAPAPTGFIGLGTMGLPMALNIARTGAPLMVWNRSTERCKPVAEAGATIARSAAEVFAACETVILMLADEAATDSVLARGTSGFAQRVGGRRIVAMGTVRPGYSRALADDIEQSGGRFVEAPVSGSRKPAEAGTLVGMLAGRDVDAAAVRPLLQPMCREIFACGPVPNALRMKLAVNLFLITMVTGLAEAVHFAQHHGLDLTRFAAILDAGPMASDVSKTKLAKWVQQDFARQAAISDVLKNSRLVVEAAREAGVASPQIDNCAALYAETEALGLGDDDMIAVIRALEQRTNAARLAASAD
ncbi:NAD(P)-dependent oxidoreductase [Rubrivivax sp. JA1024]|nr:NAD(P)-dependent oxidoreductase [Rubrivivax sp. JA1024]